MLILIGSDSILYKILTSGKCTLIHSGVFRASRKGPRSCDCGKLKFIDELKSYTDKTIVGLVIDIYV